jgi:hypothetical protein
VAAQVATYSGTGEIQVSHDGFNVFFTGKGGKGESRLPKHRDWVSNVFSVVDEISLFV